MSLALMVVQDDRTSSSKPSIASQAPNTAPDRLFLFQ
jgi:hypothetical protein